MSNYRLLYSASSNFKADIPKSMLIKDICTSNFSKFSFAFKCLCSELRGNEHNLVFFLEFIFALIKQNLLESWLERFNYRKLREKFPFPFLRKKTAGDWIKFFSLCTDASSPQKKLEERASLHRLQVLLTLSTKSNYAWIHLNITAAMCLTWFSFSWLWFSL